jgi:hypothetical protein
VLFELIEADSSIKVVIHLLHQLEDLLLGDYKAHTFKSLMELVNLDELIFVNINLIKHLFKCETLLLQDLE